jgi:carbonic anhydrase
MLLDASVTVAASKPIMDIPEVEEVEFENLGTTIEVLANGTSIHILTTTAKYTDSVTTGTTSFAGSDFRLVQFHMHTPSEHHLNGEYHPLEVHMVHQAVADETQLAVIALMFQVSAGASSSIIASLSSSLAGVANPGTKTKIAGGIDFTDVLAKIESSDVLQYTGSLTTPPCAEGVTFLIVKDPLDISVADFNSIKSIVKFNARYIQNAVGTVNMLEVGNLAGTAEAFMPPPPPVVEQPVVGGNSTLAVAGNATVGAQAVMSKGHVFTVTELHGQVSPVSC